MIGRHRLCRGVAVLMGLILVVAACSGGIGDEEVGSEARDAEGGVAETSSPSTTDVLDDPRWANVTRGPEASDETPREGGEITVAVEDEANTFAPWNSTAGQTALNVVYAIFDPLVTRDANGEIRPYLAESIEPNEDFTEWTLTLRPDVLFHDGTPLDAEALKRNWDDYLTAEGAALASTASQFVQRMEVVGDLTVTYVMTHPNPAFPELLELQIGWPFSPAAADEFGDALGDRPVGTGPFRFVSWERDSQLVVERNPDYWREGLPYLDRITFRPIPDDAIRVAALASGDVDAVQSRQLSENPADLADIDDVQVVLGMGNGGGGVIFNTTEPPTDDLRVRRSLVHALDRDALLQVAGGEAAELSETLTQFFPQGSRFYSEAVAEAWPEDDPGRAEELYNEYINDPDRSDGKSVGEPVSLTLNVLNRPATVELAEAYEGFYEAIGFEVEVRPLDRPARAAAAVGGDFQATIFPIGRDSSPLGEFQFYFEDPDEVITNFSNLHDETVADLLERLRSAATVDEQAAITEEFGLYLADRVPWHWLGRDLPLIAADTEVRGLRSWTFPDGTLGDAVSPGGSMFWGQAWVDDS